MERRTVIRALIILAAVSALCATTVFAEKPAAPRFVARELIVRFNDSVTDRIDELVDAKRSFTSATTDLSDSLDRLFAEYGVQSAQLLYHHVRRHGPAAPGRRATLQELKQHDRQRRQALKHKYVRRSDRAPKRAVDVDPTQVWILTLSETADVEAAAAAFSADPHVVYASPNRLLSLQADPGFPNTLPDDTYLDPGNPGTETWSSGSLGPNFSYPNLWGLQQVHAEQAWRIAQGNPILVAVVDTGVDYTHPDLDGNIWTNAGDPTINSVDDDGNGYVDDLRGWNFSSASNVVMDKAGHGTHVAGIIAAETNNGLGSSGTAPQVKIMAVRVTSDSGALTSDAQVANAITYAAENGADIINCSFGCAAPCPPNPVLEGAIREAYYDDPADPDDPAGVIVVFAAGNAGQNVADFSPQNMPETLVAGSSKPTDQMLSDSNRGVLIDVVAPGERILSLRTSQCYAGAPFCGGVSPQCTTVGTNYCYASGTSMAAPFVSGAAALLLAHRPSFSVEEVRQALRATADASTTAFLVAAAAGVASGNVLFGGASGILIDGDTCSGDTCLMYENAQGSFNPITVEVTAIDPGGDLRSLTLGYPSAPGAGWSTPTMPDRIDASTMHGTFAWSPVSFANLHSCSTEYQTTFSARNAQGTVSRTVTIRLIPCGPDNPNCAAFSHPPVAIARGPSAAVNGTFTLYGDQSCDPEGDPISSYQWTRLSTGQILTPLGAANVTDTATGGNTVGYVSYRLTVSNSGGASSADVTVTTWGWANYCWGCQYCFIATAAYGSPLAPELDVLRAYRDGVLARSALGRTLVSSYYRLAPPVAQFIEDKPWLRALVRKALA
ncbi:MAG: S8 family serine peptidase, partial [Candidatus Omnitrophica bacterium]|nr:S8 family serine peptidase [Candidatus Omnitrophota bacterium]